MSLSKFSLMIFTCMVLSGVLQSAASADDKLLVYVSVLPQKYFVEQIAGDLADVKVMVKPGFNPVIYSPSPQQIMNLSKADVYISIGVPFEHVWLERIKSVNPKMPVIDGRKGIQLLALEDHHHEHDHDHADDHADDKDPHVWTSPVLSLKMAETIRDSLITLRPQHQQDFEQGFSVLQQQLQQLDRKLKVLLAKLSDRRFMVFHPAWGYFAESYHLQQIVVERNGKEPGAKSMTAIVKQAREQDIKVIFVQPQFSTRLAKQLAAELDAKVQTLDPLSGDYINNLLMVALSIVEANQR